MPVIKVNGEQLGDSEGPKSKHNSSIDSFTNQPIQIIITLFFFSSLRRRKRLKFVRPIKQQAAFLVLSKFILHWNHLSVLCDWPNDQVPSFLGWEAQIIWWVGLGLVGEELGGKDSWREVGFLGFCDGFCVWREFMGGNGAVKSCHGKCPMVSLERENKKKNENFRSILNILLISPKDYVQCTI